jgi:hypothetical protein
MEEYWRKFEEGGLWKFVQEWNSYELGI